MSAQAKHTEGQVEIALATVVACAGSVSQAKKLLDQREPPLKVPETTLRRWVQETRVDQYAKLAERHGPQLEEAIVRQVRELAARAAVVQRKALDLTEKSLIDGAYDAPATAKIARDLSHVVGQNVDKLLTLTGRPTEIIEERSVHEIARGPVLRNVLKVVDAESDAVEVPELPPGEAA